MVDQWKGKQWIIVIRIFILCVVILCMAVIFWFSSQVSSKSDSLSKGVTARIAAFFVEDFDQLEPSQQQAFVRRYDNYIRKFAHFLNFAVLGFFIICLCRLFFLKWFARMPLTLTVGLLYAMLDEIHQRFVPGRGCQLRDVMIDFCGVIFGLILAEIVFSIFLFVIGLFSRTKS